MRRRDWGVRRTVAIGQEQGQPQLLLLTGYDQANGRGTYLLIPPDRRLRDDDGTRWRIAQSHFSLPSGEQAAGQSYPTARG